MYSESKNILEQLGAAGSIFSPASAYLIEKKEEKNAQKPYH